MAKIEDSRETEAPREQSYGKVEDLPEQRRQSEEEEREAARQLERQERLTGEEAEGEHPVPTITVLGRMDGQIALRLGWRKGMVAISVSRFRFLRQDLGIDIQDDPSKYLF